VNPIIAAPAIDPTIIQRFIAGPNIGSAPAALLKPSANHTDVTTPATNAIIDTAATGQLNFPPMAREVRACAKYPRGSDFANRGSYVFK